MAYGGTLIFVSHDRYFVERLATKIIEVGRGTAVAYPGTYTEFLWHKDHGQVGQGGQGGPVGQGRQGDRGSQVGENAQVGQGRQRSRSGQGAQPSAQSKPAQDRAAGAPHIAAPQAAREQKKHADAEARRHQRADQARRSAIDRLEAKIAETERAIRDIEEKMSASGFYEDRTAAQPIVDRHQALMWEVGDLMHQWEELHAAGDLTPSTNRR
jgi:ATP-binding cassette subfamily F protein 3